MNKEDYVVELFRWVKRTDINPEEVQMAVVQRLKYKQRMLSRKLDKLTNSREKNNSEIRETCEAFDRITDSIEEIKAINPLSGENDIDRLRAKLG